MKLTTQFSVRQLMYNSDRHAFILMVKIQALIAIALLLIGLVFRVRACSWRLLISQSINFPVLILNWVYVCSSSRMGFLFSNVIYPSFLSGLFAVVVGIAFVHWEPMLWTISNGLWGRSYVPPLKRGDITFTILLSLGSFAATLYLCGKASRVYDTL